jgi:DNA-binding CsgD family transcriptional regulator
MGRLSEKACLRAAKFFSVCALDPEADGFAELLLREYSALVHSTRCHFAGLDGGDRAVFFESLGSEECLNVYQRYEEHDVFKPSHTPLAEGVTTLSVSRTDFRRLARVNPLYEAMEREYGAAALLAATHPAKLAFIVIRFGEPFTDEETAIHDLVGPSLMQAYYSRRRFRELGDMLHIEGAVIRKSLGSPFALMRPHGGAVLVDPEFEALLAEDNVSVAGLESWYAGHPRATALTGTAVRHLGKRRLHMENVRLEGKAYVLLTTRPARSAGPLSLTPRELEVASMTCDGLTNRELAQALGLSIQTVKRHLYNVFRKTGVRNRVELVRELCEDG